MHTVTQTMDNINGVMERAALRETLKADEREAFWAEMRAWEKAKNPAPVVPVDKVRVWFRYPRNYGETLETYEIRIAEDNRIRNLARINHKRRHETDAEREARLIYQRAYANKRRANEK
jgi:hypothetical protein